MNDEGSKNAKFFDQGDFVTFDTFVTFVTFVV